MNNDIMNYGNCICIDCSEDFLRITPLLTCRRCTLKNYERTYIEQVILKSYKHQIGNSRQRKHESPLYTFNEYKAWYVEQPRFKELYDNWIESGCEKHIKPSCGRIDSSKPYSLDNIQLVTGQENQDAKYFDISSPVNQYSQSGKLIKSYSSIKQAAYETGCKGGRICNCCKYPDKYKHHGGFKWEYAAVQHAK